MRTLILFPMLALVGWTMGVLVLVGVRRVRSRLNPKEFALGESAKVPPVVSLPNRNYMNLLEVPVLFYVVSLTFYVTNKVTMSVVVLAWLFVVLRFAHTLVHLTYNNVLHRLALFVPANVTLAVLYVILLARLV